MHRWPIIATVTILVVGCFDDAPSIGAESGSNDTKSAATGDTTTTTTTPMVTGSTSTGSSTTAVADAGTTTDSDPSASGAASSSGTAPSCDPGPVPDRTLVYINSQEAVQTRRGPSEFACEGFILEDTFFGLWTPWGPLSDGTVAVFESHWAGYAIEFTYERPLTPPYEMIIVTNEISPVNANFQTDASRPDCANDNPDSIGFAFLAPQTPPAEVAINLSRAVAWTLGLELTVVGQDERPKEITAGGPAAASYAFIDECRPLLFGNECADAHGQHCAQDEQNSAAELGMALSR